MGWDFSVTTRPIARKPYRCDAAHVIRDTDCDFTAEERATIESARAGGWMINKGDQYVNCSGKWDGEFETFRARIDLDAICQDYDLYPED
jgi:hypothetical protein